MRKQPGIERNPTIFSCDTAEMLTVLSVSPLGDDYLSLQAIVGHSKWTVFNARNLMSALALLQQYEIAVILCERDLLPGTYVDLLEHLDALTNAPSLLVTDRK